ncbi:alpha/beta fold hydrolase [Pseudonocardia sp. T1-2H]|uniref:alpha/beta fold hydrolase n=1 Tax=Pseudonocardia sp. T1-2H TaxID=3128899 RepID=UPI003101A2AC
MEQFVEVAAGIEIWAEMIDGPEQPAAPILLVMGANAAGVAWPDALVSRLTEHAPVIRYDHRDTGRSTYAFDEHPYAIRDLAADVVAVLDAFDVERAHVVGMSMGGILAQLLLLDTPQRLLSATLMCTTALGSSLAADDSADEELPGPDPALLRLWQDSATSATTRVSSPGASSTGGCSTAPARPSTPTSSAPSRSASSPTRGAATTPAPTPSLPRTAWTGATNWPPWTSRCW